MNNQEEIWKEVPGFNGYYFVSNFARVKSIDRMINNKGTLALKRGRLLTTQNYKDGYQYVTMSLNNKNKKGKLHRLVAKAFILNPENKREVNHIDGNKRNNRVENLEWVTPSENCQHSYRIGLNNPSKRSGHLNSKSKASAEKVLEIREFFKNNKITKTDLAKKFGLGRVMISYIVERKTYKNI